MRYNFTPSNGQNLRILTIPNGDQQPMNTAGERVNWSMQPGKHFA